MNSERIRLEEELFEAARALADVSERERFLDAQCGGDPVLHARLKQLLATLNESDDFFRLPSQVVSPTSVGVAEAVGMTVGRYRLLEKIGEGGFGAVYVAEQSEPVRRHVALKIVKLGMDTKQVVARFEAERQALALMDHASIAKVFDGGATDAGRPYFVMELVRGVPISKYCKENAVDIHGRLELFVEVCQAVQHAHQKGIIHRDLKPSNVLVAMNEGVGLPKVIDFGVAKATQQALREGTIFTQFHHLIGTPAYMSPEQAEMTSVDIDTRSDIYSLGVLLYELLTGKTPFDGKELLASGLDEMRRTIRDKEPLKPSTRLARERSEVGLAQNGNWKSEIDPDLDWIVMKCLEKNRARRYETASGLAADIQRHLDNQPVLARPPSTAYRFRKLVHRHFAASLAVASVVLVLLLGVGLSTWALARERKARLGEQAALKQANQRLSAALGFLDQVLTNVAPEMRLVAGAAQAQGKLLQAGLSFAQILRESAGDNPAARVALARLLLYMSNQQNPGEPNTTGDYEAGLKQAEEAFQLLEGQTPQLSEAARLELVWESKLNVIRCLYGLARWEEGLARSKEIGPLLDQLERSSLSAPRVRRSRMGVLQNAGWANFNLGRTNEALECVLSLLSSDWARDVTNRLDSAGWEDVHLVMNAHDVAGNVYGLQMKQFEAMRPHADESVRIGELLIRRFPNNVFLVYLTAQNRAWQGYALMQTGNVKAGIAALDKARQEFETRAEKEASSDAFRRNRMIIAAVQALAFAGWSGETIASIVERRQRLIQAEQYLAEAEEFSRSVKSQSRTMATARVEVPAAQAKLQAAERAVAKP